MKVLGSFRNCVFFLKAKSGLMESGRIFAFSSFTCGGSGAAQPLIRKMETPTRKAWEADRNRHRRASIWWLMS
jgi:hypothetical protein